MVQIFFGQLSYLFDFFSAEFQRRIPFIAKHVTTVIKNSVLGNAKEEVTMNTVQLTRRRLPLALAVLAGSLLGVQAHAQIQTGPFYMAGDSQLGFTESASSTAPITKVYCGGCTTVAQRADGSFVTMGFSIRGDCLLPPGMLTCRQISVGEINGVTNHILSIKTDGTVAAWGFDGFGECDVPSGLRNVISVAAGDSHSLAVNTSGQIIAWGSNSSGQTTIPAGLGSATAVTAGTGFSAALLASGRVAVWGDNSEGQLSVPAAATNIISLCAAGHHLLALRSDHTVVAWGADESHQSEVPAGLTNVKAIAAGTTHSVALLMDGSMVCWGDGAYKACEVPSGLGKVVSIGAGENNTVVALADGTFAGWGRNTEGESQAPPFLNAVQVSSGIANYVALQRDGTVQAGVRLNGKRTSCRPGWPESWRWRAATSSPMLCGRTGRWSVGETIALDNSICRLALRM